MAKRFTDSEKWKKPFIRGLKAPYKLLWFYIWDECDPAGLWQVDIEVAQVKIGEKISAANAIEFFGQRIIIVDNGEQWFIPEFIEFQYGTLTQQNKAHTKTIFLLNKFQLIDDDLKLIKAPCKPLASPLKGDKEEGEEEYGDKAKKERKSKAEPPGLVYPFDSEEFMKWWHHWKEYKAKEHNFKYKSHISEQAALRDLGKMANGKEEHAILMIEKAISRGYKGIFQINDNNGTSNNRQQPTSASRNEELASLIFKTPDNRFGQS